MLLRDNKLSKAIIYGTKTLAVSAALLLTVGLGSSFAAPTENGNDIVIASFHREFRSANVIAVETKQDYTKVTFNMNGVVMFAYYTEKGDLMAIVRNVLSTQ